MTLLAALTHVYQQHLQQPMAFYESNFLCGWHALTPAAFHMEYTAVLWREGTVSRRWCTYMLVVLVGANTGLGSATG